MRKLTKFWNIFHVISYKSKKEIAHGSVIERFYLIKSLFCYYDFILLFTYSLLERHPQKSDKIEMATKRVRWNFMSSKRAFISFLILNYVDSDAFYHLIFSLFCSIVYRGTERTFFKVWWYCGSHGYEGSNNTAFKVWNLIFYFLKNYHVRYYIKNLLVRLKIEQKK